MSIRLSIIATRTGDSGTTGLGDGTRVSKDSLRIEAIGDIDELNCMVGLLRTVPLSATIDALFARVQNDLFDLGGELCIPGHAAISDAHIEFLDQALSDCSAGMKPLAEFILPGGCRAAAIAHLVRTICRRAERSVVALSRTEEINAPVKQYLNRLSDLCFVIARLLNQENGMEDILWSREPHDK